jgi:hypothetical protein
MSGAGFFDGSILFGFPLMRVPDLAIAGCGKLRAHPASNVSKPLYIHNPQRP